MINRSFVHNLNSSTLRPGERQFAVERVELAFGGVRVLNEVSFQVLQRKIVTGMLCNVGYP